MTFDRAKNHWRSSRHHCNQLVQRVSWAYLSSPPRWLYSHSIFFTRSSGPDSKSITKRPVPPLCLAFLPIPQRVDMPNKLSALQSLLLQRLCGHPHVIHSS
ncbi:unnamed protein product [Dicrocoelium dendriticum]|nr:unnamed protein product [Dicrocoelium dendriticum]